MQLDIAHCFDPLGDNIHLILNADTSPINTNAVTPPTSPVLSPSLAMSQDSIPVCRCLICDSLRYYLLLFIHRTPKSDLKNTLNSSLPPYFASITNVHNASHPHPYFPLSAYPARNLCGSRVPPPLPSSLAPLARPVLWLAQVCLISRLPLLY